MGKVRRKGKGGLGKAWPEQQAERNRVKIRLPKYKYHLAPDFLTIKLVKNVFKFILLTRLLLSFWLPMSTKKEENRLQIRNKMPMLMISSNKIYQMIWSFS